MYNQHSHGEHECYCPTSGYTQIVPEGIPCNTLACSDGTPMRAVQTGEYRGMDRQAGRAMSIRVAELSDSSKGLIAFGLVALGVLTVGTLFVAGFKREKD